MKNNTASMRLCMHFYDLLGSGKEIVVINCILEVVFLLGKKEKEKEMCRTYLGFVCVG